MRYVVPAALLLVALIHALPLVGAASAGRLETLYGIGVRDLNLELLLRHRAVLFGLLAAFLAYAAFDPALHRLALIAALVSVIAFLILAWQIGNYSAAISRVLLADLVALAALIVAAVVHAFRPNQI